MERNASNEGGTSGKPSLTSLKDQIDVSGTAILGLSFLAGILLAFVGLSNLSDSNEAEIALVEPAIQESARQVQDPSVVAEVAGVVCEDLVAPLDADASAADVVVAWNLTVQAFGDECTPAFRDTLGAAWVMDDTTLSIFGAAGSLYEFDAVEGEAFSSLTISLVAEDNQSAERDQLVSVIESAWGGTNLAWNTSCDDTDRPWAGEADQDGLTLRVSRCS